MVSGRTQMVSLLAFTYGAAALVAGSALGAAGAHRGGAHPGASCAASLRSSAILRARSPPRALRYLPTIMAAPKQRILDEENAKAVLNECMETLGTLLGSNEESLKVGITGAVSFVELDGPILVISLSGRFWHQRSMVVERVSKFVMDRIPECVDVEIVDAAQLDDTDPTDLEEKFAELDAVADGLSAWPTDDVAAPAPPAPSAALWEEHVDPDSGKPFYYNRLTGQSVWEKPAGMSAPAQETQGSQSPASFGNDGGRRPDQF